MIDDNDSSRCRPPLSTESFELHKLTSVCARALSHSLAHSLMATSAPNVNGPWLIHMSAVAMLFAGCRLHGDTNSGVSDSCGLYASVCTYIYIITTYSGMDVNLTSVRTHYGHHFTMTTATDGNYVGTL